MRKPPPWTQNPKPSVAEVEALIARLEVNHKRSKERAEQGDMVGRRMAEKYRTSLITWRRRRQELIDGIY